jgi:amino acid adenylation domain-containing protein
MTYSELDRLSSAYAYELMKNGVKKGSIVSVVSARNHELFIALIGILKVGAAYLPIDPDYPDERIKNIISNSGTAFITNTSNRKYEDSALINIPVDIDSLEQISDFYSNADISPDDKAYVMYTSGTSGEPKGVVIRHKSIVRLVRDTNYISFSQQSRLLQTSSVVFDASTLEIWGPLLNGGTIFMTEKKNILDPKELKRIISENNINVMFLSTSLFTMLAESDSTIFIGLEYLIAGGDIMPYKQSMSVLEKCSGIRLVNGYGPTENTTFSTYYTVEKDCDEPIPIGYPITGSTAYIIDCYDNIQAPGMKGELCVGGLGVAEGYLNNKELTDKKFFSYKNCDRLYRTGDSAVVDSEGRFRYYGRLDDQVKIRGFRIELAEIREKIVSYPQARDSYVSVNKNKNGDKVLNAFVVSHSNIEKELREYLVNLLPEYMIPHNIFVMDCFPLTFNGKIDKAKLSELAEAHSSSEAESGSVLLDIWRDVLGRNDVTENDDFFEAGGDSLKVIKLISEMRKAGYNYSVQDIYSTPVLSELINIEDGGKCIEHRGIYDKVPLTMAQEGIWFNNMNEPIYNVVLSVTINNKLDTDAFTEAIKRTVFRYPDLRTVVLEDEYKPYMKAVEPCEQAIDIEYDPAPGMSEAELKREYERIECSRIYDLTKLPMYHFHIGKINEEKYVLSIGSHHVISDAYAINILISRIEEEYLSILDCSEVTGHPETVDFADYAFWQKENLSVISENAEYWKEKLSGNLKVIKFEEIEKPEFGEFEGACHKIKMNQDMKKRFDELFMEYNVSEFVGYSAVFFIFLRGMLGFSDISIGTATCGRDRNEIQDTMGNFAYASVLRNTISDDDTFRNVIEKCRKTIEDANRYQGLPFEQIIKLAGISRKYYKIPYIVLIEYIKNNTPTSKLDVTLAEYSEQVVPSDFSLFVQSEAEQTYLRFYYKRNLFYDDEIDDYAEMFERILAICLNEPERKVLDIIEACQ